LKFAVSDPQYYRYTYTGSVGATGTFEAKAEGDLNADGTVFSTFSISGAVDKGCSCWWLRTSEKSIPRNDAVTEKFWSLTVGSAAAGT